MPWQDRGLKDIEVPTSFLKTGCVWQTLPVPHQCLPCRGKFNDFVLDTRDSTKGKALGSTLTRGKPHPALAITHGMQTCTGDQDSFVPSVGRTTCYVKGA